MLPVQLPGLPLAAVRAPAQGHTTPGDCDSTAGLSEPQAPTGWNNHPTLN